MFTILSLLGGMDKKGSPEGVALLEMHCGCVYSIVGYTGAGKSQLIRDIELLSQGESVTKRRILLDGQTPDPSLRFDPKRKIVAHLSQNMRFMVDMAVSEFLHMHAACREAACPEENARRVIRTANRLTKEPIDGQDNLTLLSGGQSRALMIADVAINGEAPIVLIDEVENAGIDKLLALEILASSGKLVLIATHDPLLALMADQRIVMQNGGIGRIIHKTPEEKSLVVKLEEINDFLQGLQKLLREGKNVVDGKRKY